MSTICAFTFVQYRLIEICKFAIPYPDQIFIFLSLKLIWQRWPFLDHSQPRYACSLTTRLRNCSRNYRSPTTRLRNCSRDYRSPTTRLRNCSRNFRYCMLILCYITMSRVLLQHWRQCAFTDRTRRRHYCLWLHKLRVYYCSEKLFRKAVCIARD